MKRIWKYALNVTDEQRVMMPAGARVIHVDVQGGVLCIWAEVEVGNRPEERIFLVVGTGNPYPDGDVEHLGSVQMPPFVWHVYEDNEERSAP